MTGPTKRWIRAHLGYWPIREQCNRVLLGPTAALRWLGELAEVRRLGRQLGQLPAAEVATIIPTYQRPDLLSRAVKSALSQTVSDQVVMVVDDGGGVDLDVSDSRVHVVSLSRNTGVVGVVRNVGIRLTRSSLVAFLDDDNEWMPDHLGTALEAHVGDVTLTVSPVERRYADGTVLDIVGVGASRCAMRNQGTIVDTSGIVARRGKDLRFSRIKRATRVAPAEDWELVYRLSRRRATRFLDRPTVRYLINETSYYTDWSHSDLAPAEIADQSGEGRQR